MFGLRYREDLQTGQTSRRDQGKYSFVKVHKETYRPHPGGLRHLWPTW